MEGSKHLFSNTNETDVGSLEKERDKFYMQVEQNFRDIISNQYGFSLEKSDTKDLLRLKNYY